MNSLWCLELEVVPELEPDVVPPPELVEPEVVPELELVELDVKIELDVVPRA